MKITAWLGAAIAFLSGTERVLAASVPDRNPVLLVHGIADSERNMQTLARHLRVEGWDVRTLNLTPNWAQNGLEPLAAQIDDYARQQFGGRKFDLVGFSMGGLVGRYYLQRLGGLKRVDHFVTLSSPHHGTALANFSGLIRNRGCQQMKPGSPFLRDLDSDADRLRDVSFTSLYSPFDLVILPARSSAMPQANNVRLPIALHPLMVLDKRCLRAVATALRT